MNKPATKNQAERHIAITKFNLEDLAELLCLPEGSKICQVYQEPADQITGVVSLLIEHPDLPTLQESAEPYLIDLVYVPEHRLFCQATLPRVAGDPE